MAFSIQNRMLILHFKSVKRNMDLGNFSTKGKCCNLVPIGINITQFPILLLISHAHKQLGYFDKEY